MNCYAYTFIITDYSICVLDIKHQMDLFHRYIYTSSPKEDGSTLNGDLEMLMKPRVLDVDGIWYQTEDSIHPLPAVITSEETHNTTWGTAEAD
jgi:hypothetical protein